MNKKILLLALAPAFALAGCGGYIKCDFEAFKEAADKTLEKAPEIESISYKGSFDGKDIDLNSKDASSLKEAGELLLLEGATIGFRKVSSMYGFKLDEDAKFYKLPGYKVVAGDKKFEYNMKGYLSKIDFSKESTPFKLTLSYKYAK